MDIHLAAGTMGGGDHKTVILATVFIAIWQLANGCVQQWRTILSADQVGLLLRPPFVHPLKAIIYECDCPVRLTRPEERVVGHFSDEGIHRRGATLRLVWALPPARDRPAGGAG